MYSLNTYLNDGRAGSSCSNNNNNINNAAINEVRLSIVDQESNRRYSLQVQDKFFLQEFKFHVVIEANDNSMEIDIREFTRILNIAEERRERLIGVSARTTIRDASDMSSVECAQGAPRWQSMSASLAQSLEIDSGLFFAVAKEAYEISRNPFQQVFTENSNNNSRSRSSNSSSSSNIHYHYNLNNNSICYSNNNTSSINNISTSDNSISGSNRSSVIVNNNNNNFHMTSSFTRCSGASNVSAKDPYNNEHMVCGDGGGGVASKVSYARRLMMGSTYLSSDGLSQESCRRQYISSVRKHCAAFRLCANVFAFIFSTKILPSINTCDVRKSFRLVELLRFRRAVRDGFNIPHDDPTSYATRSVSNLEIKWINDNIRHDAYFFPKGSNNNNNVSDNMQRASSNDVTLSFISHHKQRNGTNNFIESSIRENETQTFGFTQLLSHPTWETEIDVIECRVCKTVLKSISHPWGTRAHHCRCCGRRLCGQCINKRAHKSFAKLSKPGYPIEGEERLVCNQCYKEYLTLEKLRYLGALFALAGLDFSHLSLCRTVSQQWRQAAELCLSEYRYLLHTCEADFHSVLTPVGLFLQNSIALIVNDTQSLQMGEIVKYGIHTEAALLLLKFIAEEHLWNETSTHHFLHLLTQRSLKGCLSFSHWHFYCTSACRNMRPVFFYLLAMERLCSSGLVCAISQSEWQEYLHTCFPTATVTDNCNSNTSATNISTSTELRADAAHNNTQVHTQDNHDIFLRDVLNNGVSVNNNNNNNSNNTQRVILRTIVYMAERIKQELRQIQLTSEHINNNKYNLSKEKQSNVYNCDLNVNKITSDENKEAVMVATAEVEFAVIRLMDMLDKDARCVNASERRYQLMLELLLPFLAKTYPQMALLLLIHTSVLDTRCAYDADVITMWHDRIEREVAEHCNSEVYNKINATVQFFTQLDDYCLHHGPMTSWAMVEWIKEYCANQSSNEKGTRCTNAPCKVQSLQHTLPTSLFSSFSPLSSPSSHHFIASTNTTTITKNTSSTEIGQQADNAAPCTFIDLPHPIMHPFKPHITLRAISLTGVQVEEFSSSRPVWISFSTLNHAQRLRQWMKHHSTPLFDQGESEIHENTHISETNVSSVQPSSPQENNINNEKNNNSDSNNNNNNHYNNSINDNNDLQSAMTTRLTESQFSSSTLYETLINSPLSPPLTTNTNTNTTEVVITVMTGKSNDADCQDVNSWKQQELPEDKFKNEISKDGVNKNNINGDNKGNVISEELLTEPEIKECMEGHEEDVTERRSQRLKEQRQNQDQHNSHKTSRATDVSRYEERNDECEEQLFSFLYKRENVERDQLMCISYKLLQLFLHSRIGQAEMCNYSVLPLSENSGLVEKVDGHALSRLPGIAHNVDIATFIKQRGKGAYTNFYASAKLFLLLSYIFSIGDRHQGNVMISSRGAILHIDFGLIFSEKTFVEKLAGTTLRVDNQFLSAIAACRQYMNEQSEAAQGTINQKESECTQKSCKTEKCKVLTLTAKQQNQEICNCNTRSVNDKSNEIADKSKRDECEKKVTNNTAMSNTKNDANDSSLQSSEVKNGSLQLSSSALLGAITQRYSADYETFFDEAAEWFLVVRCYAEMFFHIWLYAVHRNCLPFTELDLSIMFNTLFDRNASRRASAFNFSNTMRYSINVCRLKDVTHSSVQVLRSYANRMSRTMVDSKVDAMRNFSSMWNRWFKSS